MNIGLGVIKIVDFDVEGNIQRIEMAIKKVKEQGIDFLCFGEAVLNGFDGITWDLKKDLKNNAISQHSEVINKIKILAIENKIAIGVGYYEKDGENIYDSYIIFGENGEKLINYRRVSKMWKPERVYGTNYQEGTKFETFEYKGKIFSIVICGDLWHEEHQQTIRNMEFDYLLWPLYISYSVEEWKENANKQYSEKVKLGNKNTFVINSWDDRIGMANGGAFYIKADGTIMKELPMLNEGILKLEL
ncbi:MAG: hypothetical protein A2Y24_04915 [Clostridiales bacterium GWE2_32_10]|nr:MAG: hypothetical protein A2Y24_04915 [Clostridiales bacterium GWE2_32_10]HBY20287.1 hypothetical protein [Clostridiales bacterium]